MFMPEVTAFCYTFGENCGLDFQLHTRDSIQLRNPDGRILDTHIAGIEILCGPRVIDRMAFLLPGNIRKEDVSKETEIWLANRL